MKIKIFISKSEEAFVDETVKKWANTIIPAHYIFWWKFY